MEKYGKREIVEDFFDIIRGFFPTISRFIREILDSFSLSGAIIAVLAGLTVYGIHLSAQGNPAGDKIWQTFATAFTTFIGSKQLTQHEISKTWKPDNNPDAPPVIPDTVSTVTTQQLNG